MMDTSSLQVFLKFLVCVLITIIWSQSCDFLPTLIGECFLKFFQFFAKYFTLLFQKVCLAASRVIIDKSHRVLCSIQCAWDYRHHYGSAGTCIWNRFLPLACMAFQTACPPHMLYRKELLFLQRSPLCLPKFLVPSAWWCDPSAGATGWPLLMHLIGSGCQIFLFNDKGTLK